MDWKQRLDQILDQDKVTRAQNAEEAKKTKLQEHQKRFFCHECNRPSSGPFYVDCHWRGDNALGYYDWDIPKDLKQCLNCHQWFCQKHYHRGYCQTCAEKLP